MNRKNGIAKVFMLALLSIAFLTSCVTNNTSPGQAAPPEESMPPKKESTPPIESTPPVEPTPPEESAPPEEPLSPQEALNKIAELLEKDDLGGLRLTIYYRDPTNLTAFPLGINDFINRGWYDEKFVINSNQLQERVDLLEQLSSIVLIPPKEAYTFIDTRICYKLETEEDGEILVVGTWGTQLDENREYAGSCIYVNGIAVSTDYDLCRIMIPFLSEDAAKGFANIDDFDSLRE